MLDELPEDLLLRLRFYLTNNDVLHLLRCSKILHARIKQTFRHKKLVLRHDITVKFRQGCEIRFGCSSVASLPVISDVFIFDLEKRVNFCSDHSPTVLLAEDPVQVQASFFQLSNEKREWRVNTKKDFDQMDQVISLLRAITTRIEIETLELRNISSANLHRIFEMIPVVEAVSLFSPCTEDILQSTDLEIEHEKKLIKVLNDTNVKELHICAFDRRFQLTDAFFSSSAIQKLRSFRLTISGDFTVTDLGPSLEIFELECGVVQKELIVKLLEEWGDGKRNLTRVQVRLHVDNMLMEWGPRDWFAYNFARFISNQMDNYHGSSYFELQRKEDYAKLEALINIEHNEHSSDFCVTLVVERKRN